MSLLRKSCLDLDFKQEAERIAGRLREVLRWELRRRGLVIAVSGGIDSSVCAALAVKAIGPGKVLLLSLPEADSSPRSEKLGRQLAEHLGAPYLVCNIEPALQGIGCYEERDNAIRRLFPAYGNGWKSKIAIAGGLDGRYSSFDLVVQDPHGCETKRRLPPAECLQIIAATNHKQRIRAAITYYHADRKQYAVVGTPNRLEYDQGFFVKNGDGAADVKPIAHLYKTQVYGLARYLGLPDEICAAVPTTDTYSLPQGQDEFYFALPYEQMDYALWAHDHGVSENELGAFVRVSADQAAKIYREIENKRAATRYLHLPPVLVQEG